MYASVAILRYRCSLHAIIIIIIIITSSDDIQPSAVITNQSPAD